MRILNQFPPNIQKIRQKFNLNNFTPIFTYGDIIYNPLEQVITEDLQAHEQTHSKQQAEFELDYAWAKEERIDRWWQRYLDDGPFRLSQEVEAYHNQYEFISKTSNREYKRKFLSEIAGYLSSELYGNLVNKETAKNLILNYE